MQWGLSRGNEVVIMLHDPYYIVQGMVLVQLHNEVFMDRPEFGLWRLDGLGTHYGQSNGQTSEVRSG